MELWAGAKTKKAKKLINQLRKPYVSAGRVVTPDMGNYIAMGQIFANFSTRYDTLVKNAGFVNDVLIAITALSIGALLYTGDKSHFQIIKSRLPSLQIKYA